MIKIAILSAEPEMVNVLSQILTREGYECLKTSSGREALSILCREPIDLFILEIPLPDMDSQELYHKLKSDAVLRDVPVIIIGLKRDFEGKPSISDLAEGDAYRSSGKYKDAVAKYKDALAKAESVIH